MAATYGASEFQPATKLKWRVSDYLERCWRAYRERRQQATLRAALYDLEDRELKDIGVSRSEIEYLVLNGAEDFMEQRWHRRGGASAGVRI